MISFGHGCPFLSGERDVAIHIWAVWSSVGLESRCDLGVGRSGTGYDSLRSADYEMEAKAAEM